MLYIVKVFICINDKQCLYVLVYKCDIIYIYIYTLLDINYI